MDSPILRVASLAGAAWLGHFNLQSKPFDDVRVRQAIAHGIDKSFIRQNVLPGISENTVGPLWPESPLAFPPGTVDLYSNSAFDVLTSVVETVTGRTFVDALNIELCNPMGIQNVSLASTTGRRSCRCMSRLTFPVRTRVMSIKSSTIRRIDTTSAAIVEALNSNQIAGAALDVFDIQPLPADSALFDCPNLLLTPHAAAITASSSRAMSVGAAEEMVRILRGERPLNLVNPDSMAK